MVNVVYHDISSQPKQQRQYKLTVQTVDEKGNPTESAIVIQNPFTIRFVSISDKKYG